MRWVLFSATAIAPASTRLIICVRFVLAARRWKVIRRFGFLFPAVGFIVLTACAPYRFYSGLTLPRDRVALIKYGKQADKLGRLRIETINEEAVKGTPTKITVLPGLTTVAVSCFYGHGISTWSSEANCVLNWDALAGGAYEVAGKVNFKAKKWNAWIKDLKTQAVLDECVVVQDNFQPGSDPLPTPLKYR